MLDVDVSVSVREGGKKSGSWELSGDLSGQLTMEQLLAYTKSALILISDQALKEEQANGFDKKPVVVVDGRKNKDVYSVNPLGKIEFYSRQDPTPVLSETMKALWERSKIVTGEYLRSHAVFVNGTMIAKDPDSLAAWLSRNTLKSNDLIRFVNLAPYARRLERLGVTAQRQQNRTVAKSKRGAGESTARAIAPNGVYFLTSKAIKRKYKNNVSIRFGFIPGSAIGLAASFKTGRSNAKSKKASTYLYPSISILLSDKGII